MSQVLVGKFVIPDDVAKELSELLTKQTIREHLLSTVIMDKEKYDEVEKQLIPIMQKIDALKNKVTTQYVPAEFNDEKYMWNYDGYEVSGNTLQVYEIM